MKKTLITAGVHGNEIGSILIAREIKGWIESRGIAQIEVIPEVNLEAIEARQRENPVDDKDLNRIFPGDPNGTRSEQIAYDLFERAKTFDRVIDLHTYGDESKCIPYMLTKLEYGFNEDFCKRIALNYAVQSLGAEGQLFIELAKKGIPSMIIEAGGANWLRNEIDLVKSTLKDFIDEDSPDQEVRFIREYDRFNPEGQGVFEPYVELEDIIEKGDIVGYLDSEPVRSPWDGIVLGYKTGGEYDPKDMSLVTIGFGDF
ncbi:MAG: succinylglutamate desuccinylase/aspartoacylase family protein [Candidatus Saliniplasma sp.]